MKKAFALLLALIMVLSLASLSFADSVTLNVVTSYGGDDGNRGNFEAAVKAYEESTGNKVNDGSATSNEEWKAKVLTDFETGSEPDVLFYFTNADAEPFISAGKVVSIDEIRAEYPDYATNMKSSMMAVAADGKQYSVPSSGYWENMFVNKAVLEDCGVAVPGPDYTWDQFLADCAAIKEAGYTPIACSLVEVPHYWFEFMVMNNGTVANHLDLPQSADDAVAAKWAAGLNDIKTLYEAGYFPANTLTASDAETVELFNSGEAAFLIDGSWKIGGIAEAVDDIENFTVVHIPGKGNRKTTDEIGGLSMGYYVTRKAWEDAEKKDAAVSFVSYMTSDDVVSRFAGVSATALKNGAEPDTSEFNSLQVDALSYTASFTGISPAVQDNLSAAAREPIFNDMASIVNGDVAAEDAVAAVLEANAE